MGVKLPDSGVANVVGVAVGVAVRVGAFVAVGVAVRVAVGVGLTVGVRVAEGVATKAGPSAAWTTKVLVKVLNIPDASFQEMIILCVPSERSEGGVQAHSPLEGTLNSWVTGSDSTVTVRAVPAGASPKNSGWVVVMTSPSLTLVKVTVVAEGVETCPSTVKPDEGVACSGRLTEASGIPLTSLGGRFLKSWVCPMIIGGTGFADWG